MKNILSHSIKITKNHPVTVIACMLVFVSLSICYTYIKPIKYQAEVKIESTHPQGINQLITQSSPATAEIQSGEFLQASLKDIKPFISYYITQDFKNQQSSYLFPYKIDITSAQKHLTKQSYTIRETSEQNFTLTSTIAGIQRIKNGTFGEEITDNNLTLTVNKKPRAPFLSPPVTGTTEYSFSITAPSYFAQHCNSDQLLRVSEQNRVITISVANDNPETATTIASSIANNYVGRNASTTSEQSTIMDLDKKIEQSAIDLANTESMIAEYKKQNQITELGYDTESSLSTLKELQQQKTQLELTMTTLNNITNHLRKNHETNNSMVEYGAINDPGFTEQIAKLNTLYQQKENNSASASTDHEIENMKVLISERILSTRKKTAVQLDALNKEIASTQYQISLIPDKANTLQALDRKYILDKKVYDLLVDLRAQAIVKGNLSNPNNRIIQQAQILPFNPLSTYGSPVAAGLLAGIISGLLIASLKQRFSKQKVRNRQDVTLQTSIPVFGEIINQTSFRNICTKILMQPETKIITIASQLRGEGKTFLVSEIGKALASLDKKVLLVDMNATANELTEIFEIKATRSIADVLLNNCEVHDAISITSIPNIDILTAGNLPEGINSLLASRKKSNLVEELRKYYDYILVDTAALNATMDAIPMMKIGEETFMVTRTHNTPLSLINSASLIKEEYNISSISLIINNIINNTQNPSKKKNVPEPVEDVQKNTILDKDQSVGFMRKIAMWFY